MDLSPLAQQAVLFAGSLVISVGVGFVSMAARQIQKRTGFALSQDMQNAVDGEITSAVNMAVGMGRAKLASGAMNLTHLTTDNPVMDQLATAAINSLSDTAKQSGITSDDIARLILAGIGHALGDDPTVPTIAPDSSPAKTAAAPSAESTKAAAPSAQSQQAPAAA